MASNDPRDTDLDYLLGPFDAKRMVRLEGVPLSAARLTREHVSLQKRFPTFDRNISYIMSAAPGTHDYGARTRPLINEWWPNDRVPYRPGGIIYNQAMFSSPQQLHVHAVLAKHSLVAGNRPLYGFPIHEHVHQVMEEYRLSDRLIGTSLRSTLSVMIDLAVPGIMEARFPVREPGLVQRATEAGISPYGLNLPAELLAEVGTAALTLARSMQSPLLELVGRFLRVQSGADSRLRIERQQDLVQRMSPEWLRAEYSAGPVQKSRFNCADQRLASVVNLLNSLSENEIGDPVINDTLARSNRGPNRSASTGEAYVNSVTY